MPQFYRTGKELDVMVGPPENAHDCAYYRDEIVWGIEHFSATIASEYTRNVEKSAGVTMATIFQISKILRQAAVVFWREDMWRASMKGVEAFVGMPYNPELVFPPCMFFIPGAELYYPDPQCDMMHLDPGVRMLSGLLVFRTDYVGAGFLGISGAAKTVIITFVSPEMKYLEQPDGQKPDMDYLIKEGYIRLRVGILSPGEIITSGMSAMVGLLEFMKLPITDVEKHIPLRAERRRLQREGKPVPDVRIINLRKVQHAMYTEGEFVRKVDWSCRWLVAGHWRKQWYPVEQTHRPVFISSYVKGPEDKPFQVGPARTVYRISR